MLLLFLKCMIETIEALNSCEEGEKHHLMGICNKHKRLLETLNLLV